MGESQFDRVQHLFLTALELPEEQRESWLIEQCGDDQALLEEIRSLLKHDSPSVDPLEKGLDQAIVDLDRTMPDSNPNPNAATKEEHTRVNDDQFLSRLADVGILSNDEISALEHDISGGEPSSAQKLLASQLVADGKLTEYQAAALLKGQPNLLIDKYLVLDLIDTGGMGTVFKAIHRPMNRIVAIKIISKHLLASPEQVQRFLREVRVAATLENVNIVRAYDADHSKGVHFLVMEYVRGENLAKIVRRDGPMTVEQAVDCIRQATNGLRYAHKRGIVHRDIKPGNLMRTDDQLVKVLDLGLADIDESFRQVQQNTIVSKENTETRRLAKKYHTEVGAVLGTAAFMAPEQSRDAASADNRSDIYSLGCTLYYLLKGEPPYRAETSTKVLAKHRESKIPSIRKDRLDVPPSVDAICRRMMAKQPGERFRSMGDLIAAIEDCEIDPPELNDPHGKNRLPKGGTIIRESRQDRADRALAERAVLWNVQPQYRHLPSWWEFVKIRLYTDRGRWTQAQRRMMGGAGLALSMKFVLLGLLIAAASIIGARIQDSTSRYALSFDGRRAHVRVSAFNFHGDHPVTLESYVTPWSQPSHESSVIANCNFAGIGVGLDASGYWQTFFAQRGSSSRGYEYVYAKSDSPAVIGRRVHVAAIFSKNELTLFIDGRRMESRPIEEHVASELGFYIGADPRSDGTAEQFFHGTIDEVRISSVARYSSDFDPRERFVSDSDTLLLYHLDADKGNIIRDSSEHGHDGWTGDAVWISVQPHTPVHSH